MAMEMERRDFIKILGSGAATAALASCGLKNSAAQKEGTDTTLSATGEMVYRNNPTTGDRVSLLGYGMMRLPNKVDESSRDADKPAEEEIDQEEVNRLVKYALGKTADRGSG